MIDTTTAAHDSIIPSGERTVCPDTAQRWRSRLSSLGELKQKEIAVKYYGGRMPWKKESKR